MSIQICLISWMKLIIRKMVERKAFLTNPKHQYRVSKYREHDCNAHNKKNRDYYGYPSLTHFSNEHQLYGEWWKKNLFLQIQGINIVYPKEVNMILVRNHKNNRDYYEYQVCLISQLNLGNKENGGKKRFSCKSKKSILCIPKWRTWL